MAENPFYEIIAGYEDSDLRNNLPAGHDYGPKPYVTVWVIAYNHEKYLRQCLEGIMMQKVNFPIEVIITDDASTDCTQAIIREYAARYPDIIRPILGKKNIYSKGRSRIYEQLLPLSRGKYLSICEGDDYWIYDGRLQALADFLDTHPSHTMVFHAYKVKSEIPGIDDYDLHLPRPRNVSVFDLLVMPHIQAAGLMGRLDVLLNDQEFQRRYRLHPIVTTDVRLFISWRNAGKVYAMPDCWSVYRVHSAGIFSSQRQANPSQVGDRHLEILKVMETFYGGKYKGISRDRENYLKIQKLLDLWTYSRRDRHYVKAVKYLFQAFINRPSIFCSIYYHRYIH
ncbi:MAG: glycosyltransferase family 2 protein [Muribaculaceae bacterium]|nr:glycosyltransferase family 2 protein [Muribaculaceae bacterium]